MGSHVWEGHAELRQALEGLACAKGTSATRVKAVANAAFKYVKDYKRVVHDVEVFLWKADVEHRLAGLYAMDAIIRQSQLKYGTKDQFTKRFSLHLTNTITAVKSIPADAQQHVRHVVQEWQTRGFYTVSQIEEAGGREYSINSSSHSSSTHHDSNGQREETTSTASAGKLASLLSIIKKQKEMKEGQQHESASILGDRPPQQHHHHHHHHHAQSYNPVPLLASPRASERIVSPSQRSSDNGHHQQDAHDKNDDRKRSAPPLLPEPPASAAIAGRSRRDLDAGNSDEWYDSRSVKKPRGSRWGPPKASDANGGSGGEGMRPPPINTLSTPRHEERDRASGYGGGDAPVSSRSPTQRPDAMVPPSSSGARIGEPSPGGRVGYGFDRDAFHDNNRFAQAAAPNTIYGPPSAAAGGRHEDREMSAPHSARNSVGGPGEKIPGTSGEVCRKFIAGRCTFGDRCWHIHDQQQASKPMRPRMEMNDAKRKTVLCSNFPRGTCRFGDNCSFAHGEKDLDRSVQKLRGGPPQDPPSFADSSSNSSRWQTPARLVGAVAPPPPPHAAAMMSSANAYDQQRVPPHHPPQNRAFGTGMSPHPVFNEVQGDRGNSGAPSMSHHHHHHHANAPVVVGGPPYQSNANVNATSNNVAPASNLERAAAAAAKDTFASGPAGPRGPPGPPGSFAPVGSYGHRGAPPPMAKMPPPPPPVHRQLPGANVPPPSSAPMYPPPQQPAPAVKTMMKKQEASANPVDEDDDVDSAAPEFTLQYDDED